MSNVQIFSEIYPQSIIGDGNTIVKIESWWDHIYIHIALHLPFLHGLIPHQLLPYAPSAFLGPAWSISLEWQFYLIAPLVFGLLCCRSGLKIGIVIVPCLVLFWVRPFIPAVERGAFLPFYIEYFFIGGLSYFIFSWLSLKKLSFPITLISIPLSALSYFSFSEVSFIGSTVLWIAFFGVLMDLQSTHRMLHVQILGFLFENKFTRYLGRISYSIYLSHVLIISVSQYVLLKYLSDLTQVQHLMVLSFVVITAFLFRPII